MAEDRTVDILTKMALRPLRDHCASSRAVVPSKTYCSDDDKTAPIGSGNSNAFWKETRRV